MKVRIAYQTQYAYAEAVSFSTHLFRLFPKPDRSVQVRSLAFQTNPGATVSMRRDLFDNEVASCFYPGKSALLAASLAIELEVGPRNAFDFLVAHTRWSCPLPTPPARRRCSRRISAQGRRWSCHFGKRPPRRSRPWRRSWR